MAALRRMTIIGLLLLLVLGSFPYQVKVTEVAADGGGSDDAIATFEVPVRGTYLHADDYHGGGGSIESPTIVDLQAHGFVPGDNICISFKGQISVDGGWGGDSIIYQEVTRLIGVFSTSNQLLSYGQAHRVPGAIDAGSDIDTGTNFFSGESNDIPEDFKIQPNTGFWIEVPRNA